MKKKQIPNKNTNLLYTYTIKTYKDDFTNSNIFLFIHKDKTKNL